MLLKFQHRSHYSSFNIFRCLFSNVNFVNKDKLIEYASDWDEAKPFLEIPGPKPIPILGNLWRYFPLVGNYYGLDQLEQHERYFKEFGKIVKLSDLKLRKNVVLLFDPNDIETLIRNEGIWPDRAGFFSLSYYAKYIRKDVFQGESTILGGRGKQWHNGRSVLNQLIMQAGSVARYTETINNIAQEFIERLYLLEKKHDGKMPADFNNELNKVLFEIMGIVLFNQKFGLLSPNSNSKAQDIIRYALELDNLMGKLDVNPAFWKWISTPDWRKFVRLLDKMTEFLQDHLDDLKLQLEENLKQNRVSEIPSVAEQLLKGNSKYLFSVIYDLIFAGVDTTASTMGTALYFLAKNKNAQERLREELKLHMPEKDSLLTKQILENMPYLKAVFKETARLAPIAIGTFRRIPKDIVLSGYQIPKGTNIIGANMFLCKQDEYFPQGNEFIPERWLRENKKQYEGIKIHPFVSLPFGFGPRSCVGKRLAQLEFETIIAKIIRNFSISWPHEDLKWKLNIVHSIKSPLKYHIKAIEN